MIVPFSPLINEEINVFDILKESWIEAILHILSFTPKSLIYRCPWITVVFFSFFHVESVCKHCECSDYILF